MERMRFTCSDKSDMSNVATRIVLANLYLDVQAKVRGCVRLGRLSLLKGRGGG
jgi:hypothetical protein